MTEPKKNINKMIKGVRVMLSMDNEDVKEYRILSKLIGNRHFPIILFNTRHIVDIMPVYKRINARYRIGEVYIFGVGDKLMMIAFKPVYWNEYKNMLFEHFVDREFKDKTIVDKYGSIYIDTTQRLGIKYYIGKLLYKFNEGKKCNSIVKNNLLTLLKQPPNGRTI